MSEKYFNLLLLGINPETIREITTIVYLFQPGWRVSIENTGKQCLNKFKNGNFPDVIVLSTKLPDMSGFELTRKIRDDSDIPIIFIAFDRDIKNMIQAFDSGADDYIIPPFNKAIFIARLHALIRRYNWNYKMKDKYLKAIDVDINKDEIEPYKLPKHINI